MSARHIARTPPVEVWVPVPGFEGRYEVSDHGNIRSLTWNGRARPIPYVLVQTVTPAGYKAIGLYKKGHNRFLVHRLVMAAFVGPCPFGQEVLHRDSRPAHNFLGNLRYGTHLENEQDKIANGTVNTGSRHGMSKLIEQDVVEVRDMAEMGHSDEYIGRHMSVSPKTIWGIRKDRAWTHV